MNYLKAYEAHGGYSSDKWNLYLQTYDEIFTSFYGQTVQLLEIGVQNGGSIEIYSNFFSEKSTIIGCDVDKNVSKLRFRSNVQIIIGDANAISTIERVRDFENSFDFIIDDGSHHSRDIVKSFLAYFSSVKSNGVYIVEDVHCAYQIGYGGGLKYPRSAIEFFKELIDVMNLEHWPSGLPSRMNKRRFERRYGISIDSEILKDIHSIEFKNSMIIIRKKPSQENVLGRRTLTGSVSIVTKSNEFYVGQERPEFVINRYSFKDSLIRYVSDRLRG
jgi:FtsJ-like methyltransferase